MIDDPWDALQAVLPDSTPLERRINAARPEIARPLERVLGGDRLTLDDLNLLLETKGQELAALVATADQVRRTDVGDVVTYVINRNVNFTNVCFVGCQFCAFKRQRWESDAYTHTPDVILAKIDEAIGRGATEICMQGGINPQMAATTYQDLVVEIRKTYPSLHIHAFSPMEILYGSRRMNMPFEPYLQMLKDAGLGSIPGTAAEILDDEVREILSYKKVDTAAWVEIVTTAHRLGIPSTCTMMYGHLETTAHIAAHLGLLRQIQTDTGGFTEFVPLRFIHDNTVLYRRGLVEPRPRGIADLRIYAASRLFFRGSIDNLQTSWVKLGHRLAAATLQAGCNDFGGTLMEESISREAGADAGEYTTAEEIVGWCNSVGRPAQQRTTLYRPFAEPPVAALTAAHA